MAFKKCTSGVAWWKGGQNLESVRLALYEKQYFTPVLTCSILVKTFHTCSHLFLPVHTCSHLFTPVHTCSHLFTPVHTSSHRFTPVHTCSHLSDYAFRALQFLIEFSPCESCYFSILRAILLKLHIFAHLIESYPTVYGLSSCVEKKILIPLVAHTTVTMYARHEMLFLHFRMLLLFSLTSYPTEIPYFNSPC